MSAISPAQTDSTGGIVCPFVAVFDADSRLNVEANTSEVVTINNIDHAIDCSAANLAAAFDCSGWGINKLLEKNQLLVSELVVSLPSSGSALKAILSAAVTNGQLKDYLEGEFDDAFQQAFPEYTNQNDISGDNTAAAMANPNPDVSGAQVGTGAGAQADAGSSPLSASLVRQTATVYSYAFAVDICGDEAGDAMVAGLTDATSGTARLNSLFLQLPYDNLTASTVVDGSGNPIITTLPLEDGDSITFVFDVSVDASTDPNTSNAVDSTPNGTAGTDNPGSMVGATEHAISMDLGARRVSFKIPYSSSA